MSGYKSCPKCGSDMFEDMDRCFECMYEFPSTKTLGRTNNVKHEASFQNTLREVVPLDVYDNFLIYENENCMVESRKPMRKKPIKASSTLSKDSKLKCLFKEGSIVLPLAQNKISIGSCTNNTVVLDDEHICSFHLMLECDGSGLRIKPMSASAHFRMEGKSTNKLKVVHKNCTFYVGQTKFEYIP